MSAWVGERGLAGRFGGDEFVIIAQIPSDALSTDLQALSDALNSPVRHGGQVLKAGASIGAVALPSRPFPPLAAAKHLAEITMYEVKHGGRAGWRLAPAEAVAVAAADQTPVEERPLERVRDCGPGRV